jgi:hypothetical protein
MSRMVENKWLCGAAQYVLCDFPGKSFGGPRLGFLMWRQFGPNTAQTSRSTFQPLPSISMGIVEDRHRPSSPSFSRFHAVNGGSSSGTQFCRCAGNLTSSPQGTRVPRQQPVRGGVSKFIRCAAPNGMLAPLRPGARARSGGGSTADEHGFSVPNPFDKQTRRPPRQCAANDSSWTVE